MATRYDIISRLAEAARRAGALSSALALVAATAQPGWAQNGRRRSEPEANPQFQQQLQGQDAGGGPVSDGAPLDAAPSSSEETAVEPRGAQGIQIGAAPITSRPASREAVSPLETRVTVRVKGAPLATFLDTISAQAKINFIITEGLEARRVTAFLQNVTVREALQVLLEIKGLTYQQIGKSNTYVVTPRSKTVENLITRIYTLSYIPLINLAPQADPNAGGQGGGGGGGLSGGQAAGGVGGGGTGGTASAGAGAQQPQDIAILTILESIMSRNGRVAIEPRTNALVVTDIPEVFPQIEQIIAELDRKAPQIMIEAQIVEINSNRSKDLGIRWSGSFGTFRAGTRETSFPMVLNRDATKLRFLDPVGVDRTGAAILNPGGIPSPITNSVLDLSALTLSIDALVTRGEARFLGKPKVLTLNNKQATIEITRKAALNQSQQQSSAGGAVGATVNSVQRENVGLILRVTPQVNKDGYITMLLNPEFSSIVPSAISVEDPVFDPIKRAASTLVRVKNGQTLVLGGLLQSQEQKSVFKVPFLGYIPLIGWLFTKVTSARDNTDLVIFITPTLVAD